MRWSVRSLVTIGLFIALSVLLGTVLSIKVIPLTGVYTLNVSLTLVPIQLTGFCFGPVAGFLSGFLADLIKWAVNPMGAYHPGFGFDMGMMGVLPVVLARLFTRRKQSLYSEPDSAWLTSFTWGAVLPSIALSQLIFLVFLNSYWIAAMAGVSIAALLPTRLVSSIMMAPVYTALVIECGKLLGKLYGKEGDVRGR